MSFKDFFIRGKTPTKKRSIQYLEGRSFSECISSGYHTLDQCPEIIAGCSRIAQLIASMTVYLMTNTSKGDKRIVNELSRKIDISPCENMTRQTWMTAIVMNMLVYGRGNAIVIPRTEKGYLGNLEIAKPSQVTFWERTNVYDYYVDVNAKRYASNDVLHFVFNPDPEYPWKGRGVQFALKDVIDNLAQGQATKNAFMSSKWKPSIIVKVDGLIDEFSTPEGRKVIIDDYMSTSRAGEPWLIPADQFDVQQVKPLTLADLAINDSVTIDKRTVAAVLGVPAFVLGVGDYNAEEWDSFINNTIRPISQGIEQELTKKLILSPKMYLMFNMNRLYSYDLQKICTVYSGLFDKGIVTGNEVREKIGMQPLDGLDELLVLENYIPVKDAGNQKKLNKE